MIKVFLFLKYLNFFRTSLVMLEKRFDEKAKVNFKIQNVTDWNIDKYNMNVP